MRDELKNAVTTVIKAMREDKDYRYSWQANIAVQFQDAWERAVKHNLVLSTATREQIHAISNDAADRFLTLLCMEPTP